MHALALLVPRQQRGKLEYLDGVLVSFLRDPNTLLRGQSVLEVSACMGSIVRQLLRQHRQARAQLIVSLYICVFNFAYARME